ncbi:MAG: hypothetical protein IPP71_02945 [Bacteroidetes bacterium]|nr:hypothetical protein [Bacteroidota bacterium]
MIIKSLVIYRDCFNGIPPFDDPAAIGIFDGSGNLFQTILPVVDDSSLVFYPGNCIPGNVCICVAIILILLHFLLQVELIH